jgi:hypothetical protein
MVKMVFKAARGESLEKLGFKRCWLEHELRTHVASRLRHQPLGWFSASHGKG